MRALAVLALGLGLTAQEDGARLVAAARAQIGVTVRYDGAYRRLAYPGGDVPMDRGVCTDVVIRAYRVLGIDLQVLVHQDMARHRAAYPNLWGARGTDRSIDHRRTPNQIVFFRRFGDELPTGIAGEAAATWKPGDIVYCRLPGGAGHVGVCSNARNRDGLPLVIHNLSMARQEDCLTAWQITHHFRFPANE